MSHIITVIVVHQEDLVAKA